MTDLPIQPQHSISTPEAQQAIGLLRYYGFDLAGFSIEEQMADWLEGYPARWILQAITEALYQGRYKAVSVNQILSIWQRRGQPLCHFNHEFERIVGGNLTAIVHAIPTQPEATPTPPLHTKPTLSYREMLQELPSARAASKLKRITEIPTLKLSRISIKVEAPDGNVAKPVKGDSREEEPDPLQFVEEKDEEQNPEKFNFEPIELEQSAGFTVRYVQAVEPINSDTSPDQPSYAVSGERETAQVVTFPSENDPEREFKEFKEGVVFALSSGLAASALKPRIRLLLSRLYQIDWLEFCTSPKAIDQFIPTLEPSEFHHKLKTVAEPGQAERE